MSSRSNFRASLAPMVLMAIVMTMAAEPASAQRSQIGLPFITNYSPRDYGANAQNWGIAQDDRGVMYFGNGNGVLEFDGVNWRLLEMPGDGFARNLAQDEQGTIYVTGISDFGYLAPDAAGQLQYVSLVEHVPDSLRDFADVFEAAATSQYVYFRTPEYLFRWDGHEITTIKSEGGFHVGAVIDDIYYIRQWDVGLTRIVGDGWELVPGGERFADERIYLMLPYDEGRILVGTRTQGFFLFDGRGFEPFPTEADDYLQQFGLYLPGTVLNDGSFAMGTSGGGVVRIDHEGRLVQILNKATGLQDDSAWFVYVDRAGDLWVAMDRGLSHVETGSPFTVFGEYSGVTSAPLTINSHKGATYVGTSSGLLRMNSTSSRFAKVAGINDQVFVLNTLDDVILAGAGRDGLYRIEDLNAIPYGQNDGSVGVSSVWNSDYNKNLTYVSSRKGVTAYHRRSDGRLDRLGHVDLTEGWTADVVEVEQGILWAGSIHGLFHISFPVLDNLPQLQDAVVEEYGVERGLPEGGTSVSKVNGVPYVISGPDQVFRFDESTGMFFEDTSFEVGFARNLGFLTGDANGRLWSILGGKIAVGELEPDGSYTWQTEVFGRLSDAQPGMVHVDQQGIAWVSTFDGVVRYDPGLTGVEVPSFRPVIGRVTVGEDSLLFGGVASETRLAPVLDFSHNTIRFDYSLPSYVETSRNQFRVWLEGQDDGWSIWNRETSRTYSKLPFGQYRFHVRGRDVSGVESDEAIYAFRINPPWYRSWLAYALYGLFFGTAVFGIDRTQRHRLTRKERERSQLLEAELRAETAAAEAKTLQSENERQKNVQLLSEIGQSITGTLSVEAIIDTVYENVNALMDASVFGIGLYHESTGTIDFPATREKGERLPPYQHALDDKSRLASWCFNNRKEVLIADYAKEYKEYLAEHAKAVEGDDAASILYLPLVHKGSTIGVITAQSFEKNAYSEYQLNILRNLATYTAIAIDNAEAYDRLNSTVGELNKTLSDLKSTQDQLVTQEKMASLGQLTAGIAHEIKNPLNFVNNFADLNLELASDLASELKANREKTIDDIYEDLFEMLMGLKSNAGQIAKHGKRADAIVENMMQHAAGGAGERYPIDINAFVEEYISLAYHGIRAKMPDLEAAVVRDFDESAGNVIMTPQEMGRVLVNLLNNAFYAVHDRARTAAEGYRPTVTVSTRKVDSMMEIRVADNGPGIPDHVKEKIFEPLFTTKPAGSGTGLGLSLAFEIVSNGHNGSLSVESTDGDGATFVVSVPLKGTP